MSRTTRVRRRVLSIEFVAGWLFADLLLVLFLTGLGSAQPQAAPLPEPEPEPVVATPTPKPEQRPKPKPPKIIGMRTEPTSVTVSFDADALLSSTTDGRARDQVCKSVRRAVEPIRSDRAALVLIFGGASDVGVGQELARRVGAELSCANDTLFAGKTPTRPFWDGALPEGDARLEIFTFTTREAE